MSDATETPQQRQARIRQQKREAKIKASAQDRLDKITQLSGRTPESIRNEAPAPTASNAQSPHLPRDDPDVVLPTSAMFGQTNSPNQPQIQEEYMRALLGQNAQGQQPGVPGEDDPMMKMLQGMLGNMSGDPDAAGPGAGEMPFSANDISKMTGMPSFVTNMFLGGKQQAAPTPKQIQTERTWKIVRTIVSIMIGLYTILTINTSVETFGQHPPAPATARNPFVVFLTGELLVNGARTVLTGQPGSNGSKSWFQSGKDIARDGAILVFVLGVYSWWKGYA